MRLFGRFLYALLAVGFFLLTFTYAIDLTANKFYKEVFGASLIDEDSQLPEFYYFYTSIPDFHKADPIISIDTEGYIIRGYEVAKAKINNNNELEIFEALYLIVYSDTQDLSRLSTLQIIDSDNIDNTESIWLARFKMLNILNGVNDNNNVYLDKELFLSNNFDKICLVDKDEVVLTENEFAISESEFTIKDSLIDFYNEYNRIPNEDDINKLSTYNIGLKIVHTNGNNQLDGSIMIIAMASFFIILIIATYLIFFRKRKYD